MRPMTGSASVSALCTRPHFTCRRKKNFWKQTSFSTSQAAKSGFPKGSSCKNAKGTQFFVQLIFIFHFGEGVKLKKKSTLQVYGYANYFCHL